MYAVISALSSALTPLTEYEASERIKANALRDISLTDSALIKKQAAKRKA